MRSRGLQAPAQAVPSQDVVDQSAAFGPVENSNMAGCSELAQREALAQQRMSLAGQAHVFLDEQVVRVRAGFESTGFRKETNGHVERAGAQLRFGRNEDAIQAPDQDL